MGSILYSIVWSAIWSLRLNSHYFSVMEIGAITHVISRAIVVVWLFQLDFVKVPEEGLLMFPRLPDSTCYGTEDEFGAEGLKLEPIIPMKKWKISYRGQLK